MVEASNKPSPGGAVAVAMDTSTNGDDGGTKLPVENIDVPMDGLEAADKSSPGGEKGTAGAVSITCFYFLGL